MDKFNADCAATAIFGLRREAQRHAAFGGWWTCEKRCRRYALPPHSKSLSKMCEPASLYYGLRKSIEGSVRHSAHAQQCCHGGEVRAEICKRTSRGRWTVRPVGQTVFRPYYNDEYLSFPGKQLAAKERKEHNRSHLHLCVPCVLSRLFPVVAAKAALGLSLSIRGYPELIVN
jgi:hypothetical protein